MKLTQEQKQGIINLYGADTTGAANAIEVVEKKKGVFRFFAEDGSVNISKSDFEKKINKQKKVKKTRMGIPYTIIADLHEVRNLIRKLPTLSEYDAINNAFKSAYDALKDKKVELKDAEMNRLQEQMLEIQKRIEQLSAAK